MNYFVWVIGWVKSSDIINSAVSILKTNLFYVLYNYYNIIFAVAPSVSNAVAVLNTLDEYREMHSVTVTCIIHPESEAEFCEVMLITSKNLTKIGNHITHLIMHSTHNYNV